MKRVSEFTQEECESVFKRLTLPEMRVALGSVITSDSEVQVYISDKHFRDILGIIAAHSDLQTWGRLKRACKLFNKTLQIHPEIDFLSRVVKLEESLYNEEYLYFCAANKLFKEYFLPCFRRFLFYYQSLAETAERRKITSTDQFLAGKGGLPGNASFDDYLAEGKKVIFDSESGGISRKWCSLYHLCKISFPHGFIFGDNSTGNVHGNIFSDFSGVLHLNKYDYVDIKPFAQKSKEERQQFKKWTEIGRKFTK